MNHPIPMRRFSRLWICLGFINKVADSKANIRVHSCHAVVLDKFRLSHGNAQPSNDVWRHVNGWLMLMVSCLLGQGKGCLMVGRLLDVSGGGDAKKIVGQRAYESLSNSLSIHAKRRRRTIQLEFAPTQLSYKLINLIVFAWSLRPWCSATPPHDLHPKL